MFKILVVDDEADLEILIKQKFRKQIREKIYDFYFAENGKVALDKIRSQPDIDLVLTDINMPGMDGLTFLSHLNESNPLIKTVIVSAYGDMQNIRLAMNRGAFDFITKPINFEDLSITMEKTLKHAQQIKKTLQAIKENDILKMYVDENVLSFMSGQEFETALTANETIDATVMFIDICGFTSISENIAPDIVVALINTYFDIMVKEITAQDGLIDKFIGDAIMSVFRGEYHLDRAIDTAITIRKLINDLPDLDCIKEFKPSVSIGLKSGEMISGNIGSVSLKRLDYTVIGDTVNVASRLQDVAKANQIVICNECHTKVKDAFKCEKLGSIALKNKARPVTIYQVLE